MQKKLLIHFFVQSMHKQGTYFRFHNLALGLSNRGHTVRVYCGTYTKGEKSRIEKIEGIEYHITACYFPLQSLFGSSTHPLSAVKRALKKYPTCEVAHLFQPHLGGYLPWFFNHKKAKQNFYDWDDLWTDGLVKKGRSFREKFMYRQVKYIERKAPMISSYITTCSMFLSRKAYVLGADRQEIIYNGYWNYQPNGKAISRSNIGLDKGAFYLGFMGRTVNEMEWCFDLLKNVIRSFPNVRLALCGMPEEVLNKVEDFLRANIDYLGLLPPLATRDFASAIDIGLLPLENDLFNQSRFPIKFAEYLAAGTPVLITDVSQCAEIAKDLSFVKIAKCNKESWKNNGFEMIRQILDNTLERVNRKKIEVILSWDQIAKKLERAYFNKT